MQHKRSFSLLMTFSVVSWFLLVGEHFDGCGQKLGGKKREEEQDDAVRNESPSVRIARPSASNTSTACKLCSLVPKSNNNRNERGSSSKPMGKREEKRNTFGHLGFSLFCVCARPYCCALAPKCSPFDSLRCSAI